MDFKKTAAITVVTGLIGGALLLSGVFGGGSSGGAPQAAVQTATPRVTPTPEGDDNLAAEETAPAANGESAANGDGNLGSGTGVSLPEENEPPANNGGGDENPAPQPDEPDVQDPEFEEPQLPDVLNAPPHVVKTTPQHDATGIARGTKIQFHFSEPMDKASVNTAFQMVSPTVPGTLSWDAEGKVLTFDPDADFDYGEWVEATVGTSAKDTSGLAMQQAKTVRFRVMRITTVDLFSVAAKDGYVYSPAVAALSHVNTSGNRFEVGTWQRGFLTFNLSALPEDVINVTAATLSVYQSGADAGAYGNATGQLRVESVAYGSLDISDYAKKAVEFCLNVCAPVNQLLSSSAGIGTKSADVLSFVKLDLQKGEEQGYLSQFRLRFQTENQGNGPEVSAEFHSGEGANKPKLRITYTHP